MNSLFPFDANINLLPYDGEVYYYEQVIERQLQENYFQRLLQEIDWKHDELLLFGKRVITSRKVAWYADENFAYSYSNSIKIALKWTATLLELKKIVEAATESKYNSCLLNLYHSGEEGMGWHSDNEPELVNNSSIASLSLGSTRKFAFKHKESGKKVELFLEGGSLLDMKGEVQHFWKHALPKSKKITKPRINLTFRRFKH